MWLLTVAQEFCEDCPDESRLVTRDPALQDNAALPAAFQHTAGDLLYAGLRDGLVVDGQVGPGRAGLDVLGV